MTTRRDGNGLEVMKGPLDEARIERNVKQEELKKAGDKKTEKEPNKAGSIFYGLFSAFFEL